MTPDSESFEADVDAAMAVSRVMQGIAARSAAELPHELTLPQLRALVVLGDRSSTTVNGLAERLGIKPSTTTRLADRLVAKRLILRQPGTEDRREIRLALSASGQRVVRRVMDSRRRQVSEILASLPAPERAAMRDAFAKFAAAGERLADPFVLDAL
jgi:DNA-binding MarR family transcriptional regulator